MSAQPQQKIPDTVYLSFMSDVTPTSAEGLMDACTKLCNGGVKTIYLLINTPGGSVLHGIGVYNLLLALPSKIITHNVGTVDSIGNVIFLAGEERYANPGATFIFHGVAKPVLQGNLDERMLKEGLDNVRADQIKIANVIRARSKFTDESEIEKLFFEAAWIDAEHAKTRGIVNDVRAAKIPTGCPVHQLVFQR